MNTARAVADNLIRELLRIGAYEELGPISGGNVAAAAAGQYVPHNQEAFAGLAVRGVGVRDVPDDPECIIYVSRTSRKIEKKIPETINGVTISVAKVGKLAVRPEAAASSAANGGNAYRNGAKIACGSSVAPAGEALSGTLGAIVYAPQTQTHYCLSNNHVFGGCNHVPKGQPIISPSNSDARPGGPPLTQFATMDELLELRSGDPEHVPQQSTDFALAKVDDLALVSSMQGTFFDTPTTARSPQVGDIVKKVGRTTGLTYGEIESYIPTILPVAYKSKKFNGVVTFSDVWAVRSLDAACAFALQGDSGSLVALDDNSASVGMVFACSNDGARAFIADITYALRMFKGGLALMAGL